MRLLGSSAGRNGGRAAVVWGHPGSLLRASCLPGHSPCSPCPAALGNPKVASNAGFEDQELPPHFLTIVRS